jgi:hypothetical protein
MSDGDREVRITKHWVPVNCHVEKVELLRLCRLEMLRWLKGCTNGKPFYDPRRTGAAAWRSIYATDSAGMLLFRSLSKLWSFDNKTSSPAFFLI